MQPGIVAEVAAHDCIQVRSNSVISGGMMIIVAIFQYQYFGPQNQCHYCNIVTTGKFVVCRSLVLTHVFPWAETTQDLVASLQPLLSLWAENS